MLPIRGAVYGIFLDCVGLSAMSITSFYIGKSLDGLSRILSHDFGENLSRQSILPVDAKKQKSVGKKVNNYNYLQRYRPISIITKKRFA